ncbi:ABC transporter substrate-binding protein [Microbacterium sp. NPDC016588]
MAPSMKKTLALLGTLLVIVGLTACNGEGSTPATGGERTLHVARSESFDGWDPDKAAAYSTYQTLQGVLEPLLRFAPEGDQLEPGLATAWSYDADALTWTFTVRDDAMFSDGTPLTSADVVFSAGVWAEGSNYGSLYANITDVSAPDEHTVVFSLARPDTTLPVLMTWSSSAIFPNDFGGLSKKDYFAAPVAAGAFTVADWSPGGRIVLDKNPHYYQEGRPYVDQIVIEVVPDATERAAQFQAGQIDISEYVSPIDAKQYGDDIVTLPASQIEHLSFNTTRGPLADPAVRRALAQAIDYESIAAGPFRGVGTEPRGIVPPNLANWAPPTVEPFRKNVDAAENLLAESGADVSSLELVYDAANPTDHLVAQILKESFAEIDVELTLTALETGAFLSRAYGLDADMVLWSYGAVSPDVIDPLGWITGTSWLFTGFETDTVTDQFFAYGATESVDEKKAIVSQVQDDALRNAQAISLAEFQVQHAVSAAVSGFEPAPWGMYYWDTIKVSG